VITDLKDVIGNNCHERCNLVITALKDVIGDDCLERYNW
jgi:hypothetical protein